MRRELELLLREAPISTRDRPELRGALRWAERQGEVVAVLPGIYCASADAELLAMRAAAGTAAVPDAVVEGRAAAALTFWPELAVPSVGLASRGVGGRRDPGFVWSRRWIDPGLVLDRGGLRVTVPELTVLDLIPSMGGRPIDEALRRRVVSITSLEGALAATPGRRGNALRARLLADSRDEPWSEFERQTHVALREAGVSGWRANHRVVLEGRVVFLDIAFPRQRLACELDSWEHHRDLAAFIRDRERDRALQLAGWQVLRFTWADLPTIPDVVQRRLGQLDATTRA